MSKTFWQKADKGWIYRKYSLDLIGPGPTIINPLISDVLIFWNHDKSKGRLFVWRVQQHSCVSIIKWLACCRYRRFTNIYICQHSLSLLVPQRRKVKSGEVEERGGRPQTQVCFRRLALRRCSSCSSRTKLCSIKQLLLTHPKLTSTEILWQQDFKISS